GIAALATAREFGPDLVLLDIGLPGLDGYEVARRLRADATVGGAMLVAFSGYGQEEDRRRAAEAGFDRHVVKPADPQTIYDLLAQARVARPRDAAVAP